MLETDNIKLFHHMKKGITPPNEFGKLVKDILRLSKLKIVERCLSLSLGDREMK